MCKAKLDGGRRCACDTSKSRRLRRHNATALVEYAKHETAPEVEVVPVQVVAPKKEVSIEVARSLAEDVTTLRNFDFTQPGQSLTLSDGSIIKTTETELLMVSDKGDLLIYGLRSQETQFKICEHQTRKTGQVINQLANERSGVDLENLPQEDEERLKVLKESFDKAIRENEAVRTEVETIYGGANIPASLQTNSSLAALRYRVRQGDEEAMKWARRVSETGEVSQALYARVAQGAIDGTDEGKLLIKKQAAALKEVLSEIREIGGVVETDPATKPIAARAIRDSVGQVYPKDWIDVSNASTPVEVKRIKGRAHYSDSTIVNNTMSNIENKSVVVQPKGWAPDPHDVNHLGSWVQVDRAQVVNGQLVDPQSSARQYDIPEVSSDQTVWLHSKADYGLEGATATRPDGSKRVVVNVKEWDSSKGQMVETGEQRRLWVRPQKVSVHGSTAAAPVLAIDTDKEKAYGVAIHEFAHRVESTSRGPYLSGVQQAFIDRRTTDSNGSREGLVKIYEGKRELARKDNFSDAYIGREYSRSSLTHGSHEVLSMGAEAVFSGALGGLVGAGRRKPDNDLRDLIAGLWATA